ncbi:MAG: hypothetical protein RBT05_06835 [Bacteroidales bacterium]|nr:hypothetical protein [Bacteroidales bacterium]
MLNDLFSKLQPGLLNNIAAKALCFDTGWLCGSDCGVPCGDRIINGVKHCYYWEILYYDEGSPSCQNQQQCTDSCPGGCWEIVCPTCPCFA